MRRLRFGIKTPPQLTTYGAMLRVWTSASVLANIAPKYAGAVAGVLSTMIQVGNALGVAILGIIFFGVLGQTSVQSAYPPAFNASLIYLILLAVAVAVLLQLLPRNRQK